MLNLYTNYLRKVSINALSNELSLFQRYNEIRRVFFTHTGCIQLKNPYSELPAVVIIHHRSMNLCG